MRAVTWQDVQVTDVPDPVIEERTASVGRGGTVSISRVYGGAASPMPMLQLFDKQLRLRMGQANVRRWSDDILLQQDDDVLGVESFATHHLPPEEAPAAHQVFRDKGDGMVRTVFNP